MTGLDWLVAAAAAVSLYVLGARWMATRDEPAPDAGE